MASLSEDDLAGIDHHKYLENVLLDDQNYPLGKG